MSWYSSHIHGLDIHIIYFSVWYELYHVHSLVLLLSVCCFGMVRQFVSLLVCSFVCLLACLFALFVLSFLYERLPPLELLCVYDLYPRHLGYYLSRYEIECL